MGGSGHDTLTGGEGEERIYGLEGNDSLLGGEGDDTLHGGEGDDILDGGGGRDVIVGGEGADIFVIAPYGGGYSTIKDFELGTDKIKVPGQMWLDWYVYSLQERGRSGGVGPSRSFKVWSKSEGRAIGTVEYEGSLGSIAWEDLI